jgi:hypothetical protein
MDVKEIQAKAAELQTEALGLFNAAKGMVDKIIELFARPIVECESESDFLDLLSKIADELYKGNVITENIDGPVFRWVLGQIDKQALDRWFGADWFVKIKARAQGVLDKAVMSSEK